MENFIDELTRFLKRKNAGMSLEMIMMAEMRWFQEQQKFAEKLQKFGDGITGNKSLTIRELAELEKEILEHYNKYVKGNVK
jgi:hypothetical protein